MMKIDLPNRRSVRLKNHSYMNGIYFVTINAVNNECIFGEVVNGIMKLNECGEVVMQKWIEISDHFSNVILDRFVVMPNHMHGIIWIGARHAVPLRRKSAPVQWHAAAPARSMSRHFGKPIPNSLPIIIGSFKSAVAKRINELRDSSGAKVWHGSIGSPQVEIIMSIE
ncbi:MAG: hypothetical protein K9M03_00875 [Kiritimatiellales bacterium]|nr:hypothetical protein [Kiritimatiellales bacterium]